MTDRLPTTEDWRAAAETGTERRRAAESDETDRSPMEIGLPASVHGELIEWSIAGRPNEACGFIAGDGYAAEGGRALRFVPLSNAARSPYRYFIDPQEQLAAMLELDDRDEVVWGIFHSHVASPAVPSVTDVGLAYYPDSLYLLCSLDGEPHVRAWTIRDGASDELALEVVPDLQEVVPDPRRASAPPATRR